MAAGDDFLAMERRGWEAAAAGYGFFGRATRLAVPSTLDAAGVGAGCRVVDIGSGPGYLAAGAVERHAVAFAVDRSWAMVVRRSHRHIPVVRADGTGLPFPDAVFDACVAGFYLNHLSDPVAGLRELRRVIRQGGRVATSVWDVPERARLNGLVVEAVARATGDLETPAPMRPLPTAPDELLLVLRDAGLVKVELSQVTGTIVVGDSTELLDGLASSTVRTAALVRQQPPGVRLRVRDELRVLCEPYRRGQAGLHIPVAAVVLSGQRPRASQSTVPRL